MSRNPLMLAARSQVDTPEFKSWFGESKVVDPAGKPLVVYHGTRNGDFNVFDVFRKEPGAHFGTPDQAEEFICDESVGRTYEVFLCIKRPIRLKDFRSFDAATIAAQLEGLGLLSGDDASYFYSALRSDSVSLGETNRKIIAAIEAAGYDGVVYLNRIEGFFPFCDWDDLSQMSDEEVMDLFPMAQDSWIALRPEQIKSVIGNCGHFNAASPDIRFSNWERAR